MVVTDANGDFDFEALKEGAYTLGFTTIGNLEHEDDGAGEDARKENEIEIEITRDGGDIEIRVAIEGDGKDEGEEGGGEEVPGDREVPGDGEGGNGDGEGEGSGNEEPR